ncbi:hypothetical protein RGQ29_015133 [Quercus rubra]|uniref:Uncharacterized protein n=1 Tax=Quercus rubra TaxID=3512 RepID=A0AAN7FXF4_QUERU|nr:hypothetical protein RGQ29_015133 [Quercus rubra]
MNELEKDKENRFTIFTLDSTTYACHVCPCQDYSPRCTSIRTTGDPSAVDYSSITFVFPAEACETVGGEACDAEMYAEVKIKPETRSNRTRTSSEAVERDYFKYNEPKTVFPAEACDDLGGEFCELNYQKAVY